MTTRHLLLATLSAALAPAILVTACDEDTGGRSEAADASSDAPPSVSEAGAIVDAAASDGGAGTTSFELHFEGRVGAEPFSCGRTYAGFGTTSATVSAGDLRFFIHDIVLVRAGSGEEVPFALATNEWQNPSVGLLDFEDHTGTCTSGTDGTNDVITGTAPAGDYDGVRFTVGMPQPLNHVNVETAAPPLPASKLQWTWANGFLHLSFEFRSNKTLELGDGGVKAMDPFYAHIGSTGCAGAVGTGGFTCARPNRPRVSLSGFHPATSKIVVDGKALYTGSNLDDNAAGTVPGCMAAETDSDCPPMFERLGLDFVKGTPTGASPAIFSVEAR
ncbi:MAG: metallo-mystery pair system four-Cys motif protein [Labilithrix sp.]